MLTVNAASPAFTSDQYAAGFFEVEHLLDGSESRFMADKTCYSTVLADERATGNGKPFANFSIVNPMKVFRVEVLARDFSGFARDPLWGIISLQVLVCSGETSCIECPMEDNDSLDDNTDWIHFFCPDVEANLLVLTNEPSYYVIACEVRAFGYPL